MLNDLLDLKKKNARQVGPQEIISMFFSNWQHSHIDTFFC